MSKRKRKKKSEGHVDESWLLPYSDLLTLLVALFIVLFAGSSIDMQKFYSLSNAFSNELMTGGSGFFQYPAPAPLPDGNSGSASDDEPAEKKGNHTKKPSELTEEEKAEQKRLEEIQGRVESYVEENGLGDQLDTSLTIEGLSVRIRDNILFDSGVAEVRAENMNIAYEISKLLEMDIPRSVIISGHTDNVPIRNASFESNWELSVMRAVNFMKLLLENNNLKPERFSAKGYGEFQPVASNETAEGRAKNRRVEILILPRADETVD